MQLMAALSQVLVPPLARSLTMTERIQKTALGPVVFPEPGLSGLVGVKEVLFENQIFGRPDDLTRYLYGIAAAAGTDKVPDAKAWVANQWADIAQHPYRNSQIRALVLQYLRDRAPSMMYPGGTVPTAPTPAETKLRNSFQSYAQARRTYLAQQGLYMYDAWKASTDQYKQSLAQNLGTLFDYGVVPIDFKHMLASLGSVSAAGVGVVGAYAAAQIFASQVEVIHFSTEAGRISIATYETSLFGMQGLKFFQAGLSTVGALGGALAIQAVFAILTSVAMDQFMEIVTARDKLVAAIEAAKQPVDLHTLNADQATYFWALATSRDTETEDAQIVAMAEAANNAASQKNYVQPQ